MATEYQDLYTANQKIVELEQALARSRESERLAKKALLALQIQHDQLGDVLSRRITGEPDGNKSIKLSEPNSKKIPNRGK